MLLTHYRMYKLGDSQVGRMCWETDMMHLITFNPQLYYTQYHSKILFNHEEKKKHEAPDLYQVTHMWDAV